MSYSHCYVQWMIVTSFHCVLHFLYLLLFILLSTITIVITLFLFLLLINKVFDWTTYHCILFPSPKYKFTGYKWVILWVDLNIIWVVLYFILLKLVRRWCLVCESPLTCRKHFLFIFWDVFSVKNYLWNFYWYISLFLIILLWFFILGNNDNKVWSIQVAVVWKKKCVN